MSPSSSPSQSSSAACTVAYSIAGQWGGAFQGAVKITNRSATPVNGWSLKWTYANGQVISQIGGGVNGQAGAAVTVTNADYTKTIGANGGSVDFGFIASWNNTTNANPTAFTLNGTSCAVG